MQFGFKRGMSTSLCTGTIKNVISRHIHRDTPVFACFLDASKAFDPVKHDILPVSQTIRERITQLCYSPFGQLVFHSEAFSPADGTWKT